MKGILTGLLLSAVPYGVSSACAQAAVVDGPKVEVKGNYIVVQATDGEDAEPVVISNADGEVRWVSAVAEAGDGRSDGERTHVVRIQRHGDADADEAAGGWLGVMINASCPSGEDCEVKITQVIDGSPAETAGIRSGDVIVSVEGESVSGDINEAVNMIKSRSPGDEVDIVVLRDGDEETVVATLGSRADSGEARIEIKVDGDMHGQIEDRIVTRGKMLKRDDEGNWVVTELGDLSELHDLPANIKMFVPHAGQRVIELHGDGESRTMNIQIKSDGETLSISQDDGGDIIVKRVDADGSVTESAYSDAEELEEADEEAYEIYSHHGQHGNVQFIGHGGTMDFDFEFDAEDFPFGPDGNQFIFKVDAGDFDQNVFQWTEQLDESLSEAKASYEESLKHAREVLEQLEEEGGLSGMAKFHEIRPWVAGNGKHAFAMQFGKANYSFEVRPDGQIAATLRKGDTEVVQLFEDEDDMAERKPELFEKYRGLMGNE